MAMDQFDNRKEMPTFAGAYQNTTPGPYAVKESGGGLNPLIIAALLGTAGEGVSGFFGAQESNANRALSKEELAARIAQQEKERALAATQLDPFAQQRSRQKQALLSMLMQNFQPSAYSGGKFSGGVMGLTPEMFQGISSYFGAGPMANQEQAFNATASAGSKYYMPPDLKGAGYPGSVVSNLPNLNFPGAEEGFTRSRNDREQVGSALIRDPRLRERQRRLDPNSRGI